MTKYQETCNRMKDHNLTDLGKSYSVSWKKVKELDDDAFDRLKEACDLYPEEDEWVWLSMYDIEDLMIPHEAVDWSDCILDDDEGVEEIRNSLVRKAESGHYMVFAYGCRWNGDDGYKIADSIEDAIYREYEATITPEKVSKGGKVLFCKESSHDAPMGSTTYIIALTKREYEKYGAYDAKFSDVRNFVTNCSELLEY